MNLKGNIDSMTPTNQLLHLCLGNYVLSSDWESLKPTSPWTLLAVAFWELDNRSKREKQRE